MTAQHTPGPWSADCGQYDAVVSADIGVTIAVISDEPVTWRANARLIAAAPEWRANARLIAAAPDLLTALGFVAAELNSNPTLKDTWLHDTVLDAIAKATQP